MNNILVIQTGKLGDMICTTPVFRAIKQKYPKAHLIVSGDYINKGILEGNQNVSDYILVNDLSCRSIRRMNLDVAILLTPNPAILLKLILSRVGRVIAPRVVGGFSPYFTKTYRLLLNLVESVDHRMGHYAPQEYLNLLTKIGITTNDTIKEVYIKAEAKEKMKVIFDSLKTKYKFCIAPGAGNKIKEWPPEKFGELAERLVNKYDCTIVVVGGVGDVGLAKIVERCVAMDKIVNLVGETDLEELKAAVSLSDLFIGADTGPIYIAEALGVPTVDIVGPVDEREQPPQGLIHKVVLPPNRGKPELYVMNARFYNKEEAERLARDTNVESVFQVVEDIIESL